jgi:hypothetical protein
MKKHINIIVLIIVGLAAIAVLGYCFWQLQIEQKTFNWQKFAFVHKSTTVDTSDWLTYRNEKYGWEIKYPKEWNLEEDLKTFSPIFKQDKIVLGFQKYDNEQRLTIKEWVERNDFFKLKQNKDYIAYGINNTIKFNNFDVYSGSASGGGFFETALIEKEERVVVFSYSATSNFNKVEINKIFLTILSLLKF